VHKANLFTFSFEQKKEKKTPHLLILHVVTVYFGNNLFLNEITTQLLKLEQSKR
jgi:hypothetical protein